MDLTCQSEFIFIGRGTESFLENYSYKLSDDDQGRGGEIFMTLEILNNQADAEDIGEAIFANFKQKFYEDLIAEPYDRFEEALKVINGVIATLREEKVSHFIGNLNIALAAVVQDNLFLSTTGDAEVYLVRKRFVSIISEGLSEDSPKETFVNIGSGILEPSDRVLFSSSRLLRYITKAELGKILSDSNNAKSISTALTELQDFIMTEILGRSAIIGLAIGQEEKSGEYFEEQNLPRERGKFVNILASWFSHRFFTQKFPWLRALGEKLVALWPKTIRPEPPKVSIPQLRFLKNFLRERFFPLIILLVVVLVVGTFWLRTRSNERRLIAQQQAKLNYVRELMNDALTAAQFDKTKAAHLLETGEKEALKVLNARILRNEPLRLIEEIQKQRDNLDEVRRIASPTILADFTQKRGTVSVLGLLSLKDRLYGFEYNALYEIILDKLQDPFTIHDVETVILGTSFADSNALLFLTKTGKMIEYSSGRFVFVNTKDGIWKKGVDMKTYHDRVYLLDPERNQIWRYIRRREGFDISEGYNQNADLKKGVSLAVDSSIYVLNSDGTITQLYQGQKQDYPLRRASLSAMTAPTRIYTTPELNHLYILEPSKNRVILFRKDSKNGGAQYQTQYVFEKTGVLRDLVVADNRLYVMDEKKMYFVNLSGL